MNKDVSYANNARPYVDWNPRGACQRSRRHGAATTQRRASGMQEGGANIWLVFTLGAVVAFGALTMNTTNMLWACEQLEVVTYTVARWLPLGG